jgi:hypothetical protein
MLLVCVLLLVNTQLGKSISFMSERRIPGAETCYVSVQYNLPHDELW